MPSVRALVMPVAMNASVAGRRRPAGQSGPGHWLTVIVDLAMTLSAAPHVLPPSRRGRSTAHDRICQLGVTFSESIDVQRDTLGPPSTPS